MFQHRVRANHNMDWPHEHPFRDKQIEIIAALTEGVGIRATARLVGVDRAAVVHSAQPVADTEAGLPTVSNASAR
jgi:transposase-like protein